MRIRNEQEILDINTRKAIIDEINGPENQARKDEAFKRYMCFKDFTSRYVLEQLIKQFEQATVEEMSYAVSDLSFTKKIINKLARVYNNGVKRTVYSEDGKPVEDQTKAVEEQSKYLKLNTQMKKANKYLKLQRNIALQVCPIPTQTPSGEKYKIGVKVLQPYLYDVIEDDYDREQAMCLILSNYKIKNPLRATVTDPAKEGRTSNAINIRPLGDKKDQAIADTPSDKDAEKDEYIWWTSSYHFTTNGKGEIISQTADNPFAEMPFVTMAIEQDGNFWAQGGKDVSDGAIMLNSLITNMNHIGVIQGYGQFWMKGENLPTIVKLGPTRSIRMEYTKESVEPDLGFATANAPLAELKDQAEMYLALLLTTNNLSTSGVSSQLSGGKDFASGIALILDKAESTEDVQEQEQLFEDAEPLLWKKIQKVESVYDAQGLLIEELSQKPLQPDLEVSLKFGEPRPIMSESEHLDALQKRKDLGINTEIELLMKDDPSLTEDQAKEKLKQISLERAQKAAQSIINGAVDESDQSRGDEVQDDEQDRPGASEDTSDVEVRD